MSYEIWKQEKLVILVFKKKQHYTFVNTLTASVDKPVGSNYSQYLAVHAVYIIHRHKSAEDEATRFPSDWYKTTLVS